MNKQLIVSFDISSLPITSDFVALSFLHAFKEELKTPVPKLESFRAASVYKVLT